MIENTALDFFKHAKTKRNQGPQNAKQSEKQTIFHAIDDPEGAGQRLVCVRACAAAAATALRGPHDVPMPVFLEF